MFSGSFAMQWGIGLIVDAARSRFEIDRGAAIQVAFMLVLVVNVLAYAWFVFGWHRHSVGTVSLPGEAGA
jgi:hypothetical protein